MDAAVLRPHDDPDIELAGVRGGFEGVEEQEIGVLREFRVGADSQPRGASEVADVRVFGQLGGGSHVGLPVGEVERLVRVVKPACRQHGLLRVFQHPDLGNLPGHVRIGEPELQCGVLQRIGGEGLRKAGDISRREIGAQDVKGQLREVVCVKVQDHVGGFQRLHRAAAVARDLETGEHAVVGVQHPRHTRGLLQLLDVAAAVAVNGHDLAAVLLGEEREGEVVRQRHIVVAGNGVMLGYLALKLLFQHGSVGVARYPVRPVACLVRRGDLEVKDGVAEADRQHGGRQRVHAPRAPALASGGGDGRAFQQEARAVSCEVKGVRLFSYRYCHCLLF